MNKIRAAFYARVSGEQQAAAHTIESQIAALSERAQSDCGAGAAGASVRRRRI
jgi:DNA invertase Pin-like site-specific DNA recombinase